MIKRLRKRFILVPMLSFALVLLIILSGVNLLGYQKLVADADKILSVLAEHNGVLPIQEPHTQPEEEMPQPEQKPKDDIFLGGHHFSREMPYESRYFSVLLDASGKILQADLRQIAAIDEDTAVTYACELWREGRICGFWEDYRYTSTNEGTGTRLIFLDCGRNLSALRTTLYASKGVALTGLVAVFFLLLLTSKRIIRPVAESYEKQKRFITDAGHEIKTPLTIIGADADLVEMECGENEWIADIKRQTLRLTELTNDLIYLSRMEEEQPNIQVIDFPFSDVVEEVAQSFSALAKTKGKVFSVHVEPMLSYAGDEKALRQLIDILLDNALKYSPKGGRILLELERQARALRLTVSNTTPLPLEDAQLAHLFDRFYRTDQSRNSQTGGHGLGLSIAQSIVAAHKGRIRAEAFTQAGLSIVVLLNADQSGKKRP